jgi:hypothetical protein
MEVGQGPKVGCSAKGKKKVDKLMSVSQMMERILLAL